MSVLIAPMAPFADDDDEPERPADPRTIAEGNKQLAGTARAMTAGYLVLGSLAVGVGIGWLIDHLAGTSPLWILVVPALAVASSLVPLLRKGGGT